MPAVLSRVALNAATDGDYFEENTAQGLIQRTYRVGVDTRGNTITRCEFLVPTELDAQDLTIIGHTAAADATVSASQITTLLPGTARSRQDAIQVSEAITIDGTPLDVGIWYWPEDTTTGLVGELRKLAGGGNPELWQPLTALEIDLAPVSESLEVHVNAATPAGTLTLATLAGQVGKTLVIHNHTGAARTFTPGQPAQDSDGNAATTWEIGARQVFQGRVEEIGGTPTLVQLPAAVGDPLRYKTVTGTTQTVAGERYKSSTAFTYTPLVAPEVGDTIMLWNTGNPLTSSAVQTFGGSIALPANPNVVIPNPTVAPGQHYTLTWNGSEYNVVVGSLGGSTLEITNSYIGGNLIGGRSYIVRTTAPGLTLQVGPVPLGNIEIMIGAGSTDDFTIQVDGGGSILRSENFTVNNSVVIPASEAPARFSINGAIAVGGLPNSNWQLSRPWVTSKNTFFASTDNYVVGHNDHVWFNPAHTIDLTGLADGEFVVLQAANATGIWSDTATWNLEVGVTASVLPNNGILTLEGSDLVTITRDITRDVFIVSIGGDLADLPVRAVSTVADLAGLDINQYPLGSQISITNDPANGVIAVAVSNVPLSVTPNMWEAR